MAPDNPWKLRRKAKVQPQTDRGFLFLLKTHQATRAHVLSELPVAQTQTPIPQIQTMMGLEVMSQRIFVYLTWYPRHVTLALIKLLYFKISCCWSVIVADRFTGGTAKLFLFEWSSLCPRCPLHDRRMGTVLKHNLKKAFIQTSSWNRIFCAVSWLIHCNLLTS